MLAFMYIYIYIYIYIHVCVCVFVYHVLFISHENQLRYVFNEIRNRCAGKECIDTLICSSCLHVVFEVHIVGTSF